MNRPPYSSDRTDADSNGGYWNPYYPPQTDGQPVKYPRREIVNAIL